VAKIIGRPAVYTDTTKVSLCATGKVKLQQGSERRAIINLIVEHAGVMTLGEINDHFGYDIRTTVLALQQAGWLKVVP
jgi:hypothetical protein